jgi:ATP-dependent Clp protease adapter protein ClpS
MPGPPALVSARAIHLLGRAVAGTYTYQMAETKAWLANDISRQAGFPLTCVLEPCQ